MQDLGCICIGLFEMGLIIWSVQSVVAYNKTQAINLGLNLSVALKTTAIARWRCTPSNEMEKHSPCSHRSSYSLLNPSTSTFIPRFLHQTPFILVLKAVFFHLKANQFMRHVFVPGCTYSLGSRT